MQGKVGGAIVYNEKHKPSRQGTIVYLNGGEDLSRVLNRVEQAGGTILSPKEFVSKEIGYVAYFLDSEGNRLALHSSN
ncbi:MAG: hypothetical protein HKN88_05680 [Gammaproteobacteria bacterium]|nr:hypothetical protein [Gammaproteobacteria bacterium]